MVHCRNSGVKFNTPGAVRGPHQVGVNFNTYITSIYFFQHFVLYRYVLTFHKFNLTLFSDFFFLQKHSFGDKLRKFDSNLTFVINSLCRLSSTPKIGIFHAVLQMRRCEQNC